MVQCTVDVVLFFLSLNFCVSINSSYGHILITSSEANIYHLAEINEVEVTTITCSFFIQGRCSWNQHSLKQFVISLNEAWALENWMQVMLLYIVTIDPQVIVWVISYMWSKAGREWWGLSVQLIEPDISRPAMLTFNRKLI